MQFAVVLTSNISDIVLQVSWPELGSSLLYVITLMVILYFNYVHDLVLNWLHFASIYRKLGSQCKEAAVICPAYAEILLKMQLDVGNEPYLSHQ